MQLFDILNCYTALNDLHIFKFSKLHDQKSHVVKRMKKEQAVSVCCWWWVVFL